MFTVNYQIKFNLENLPWPKSSMSSRSSISAGGCSSPFICSSGSGCILLFITPTVTVVWVDFTIRRTHKHKCHMMLRSHVITAKDLLYDWPKLREILSSFSEINSSWFLICEMKMHFYWKISVFIFIRMGFDPFSFRLFGVCCGLRTLATSTSLNVHLGVSRSFSWPGKCIHHHRCSCTWYSAISQTKGT